MSARMERQWTAAKTPGAATIARLTENRRVSPGRNVSYELILRKNKRISCISHATRSKHRKRRQCGAN
jgi:hypothetical protein